MESYWDSFIAELRTGLPLEMQQNPKQYKGINLGTFNGAYQKAWMRAGYDMYGIEYRDTVKELEEYGCKGQQGNFFDLKSIASETFDFAVMDRALCGPLLHQERKLLGAAFVPPNYSESFRILKPGGTFLTTLYSFWTANEVRQLAKQGHMTLEPTEGRRPLLWITVKKGGRTAPVPSLEKFLSSTYSRLTSKDVHRLAEAISSSKWGFAPEVTRSGTLRFLFLPDNVLTEVKIAASKELEILESDYWTEVAWHTEFFFSNHIEVTEIFQGDTGKRRKICVIADHPRFSERYPKAGYLESVNKGLSTLFDVLSLESHIGGTDEAIAALPYITELLEGGVALISLSAGDSRINPRTLEPKLGLQDYLERLERILQALKEASVDVILYDGVRKPEERGDSESSLTTSARAALRKFNRASRQLGRRLGCKVEELEVDYFENPANFRGRHLSKRSRRLLGEQLLEAAREFAGPESVTEAESVAEATGDQVKTQVVEEPPAEVSSPAVATKGTKKMKERRRAPQDRAPFPAKYLVDFCQFLAENRTTIELITYDDLAWNGDWNYEDHYLSEFQRWQNRVAKGEIDPTKCYVLLQHDVDRLPKRTHAVLREQDRLGIRSNVMIFHRQPDRKLLKKTGQLAFKDYDLDYAELRRLEEKGFVIGYHSNAYEQALFDSEKAKAVFESDVEALRKHFRIDFFCPHGGVRDSSGDSNASLPVPESLRTSLRWVLNRYTVRFHGTYSDGGLRANRRDPRALDLRSFAETWRPGQRYRLLIHPQHYHRQYSLRPNMAELPWYEELLARYQSSPEYSAWSREAAPQLDFLRST